MPHTTKEERDSARGALGACDCFQCRLMMDFDELAGGASGSPPSPEKPMVLPSIPNLRRAQERLAGYGEHRMAQDIQLAIEVVEVRASSGSTGAPDEL
jgi:hypothetical protein